LKAISLRITRGGIHGGIAMSENVIIFTNNEAVLEKYKDMLDITFVDGKYMDVLKSVRDMVHKGSKLVSHPLMGSVKPNETPFRSIIISRGDMLDVESLTIIESSIAATEKFLRDNPTACWNEKVLEDFRFVDLKLFESALESMNK
jgi:hypothetical protein